MSDSTNQIFIFKLCILFIFIMVIFHSCNNERSAGKLETEKPRIEPKDSLFQINCYLFTSARDSYLLKLNQADEVFTGTMEFRNFQKDKSFGQVRGKKEGELIRLWYDFTSEGIRSVMEIYLKQEGKDLIRGLGDVDVNVDTAYHVDPSKIDYQKGQLFRWINCNELKFQTLKN